ncbi:hypothetical protein LOAG_05144 [Loa loa]|uniref:39S ribosomal protein L22, mitochondrial n=1 Tax=Loa loa TaxID=7209 RepID=A0A1S0U1E3_LOALO|nr:hypothetical protein LOAG_05144 [Loa loa]EFO23337.2 hypothetical protein LOAG_05144 [Loa loa]
MLKRLRFLCLKAHLCSSYPSRVSSFPSISLSHISQRCHRTLYPGTDITVEEAWKRRIQLRQPKLQLDEQVRPKLYYAPEWDLEKRHDGEEGESHPMIGQDVMTPEKWNYYNKVVWPPNYVSPETGLPLLRQVYYCRESVHCSPKRMFMACHLVWRLNVDEALEQLRLQRKKACTILRQALIEAKRKHLQNFTLNFHRICMLRKHSQFSVKSSKAIDVMHVSVLPSQDTGTSMFSLDLRKVMGHQ